MGGTIGSDQESSRERRYLWTAQKKSSQRARVAPLQRYAGAGQMVSSWLKDTCPGEAMEMLSERAQIARSSARVVASRLRARLLLFPSVLHAASRAKLPGPREYDAAGIEPTLCRIREVIPQSTASSG